MNKIIAIVVLLAVVLCGGLFALSAIFGLGDTTPANTTASQPLPSAVAPTATPLPTTAPTAEPTAVPTVAIPEPTAIPTPAFEKLTITENKDVYRFSDISSDIIYRLTAGSEVILLARGMKSDDGLIEWAHIRVENIEGWIPFFTEAWAKRQEETCAGLLYDTMTGFNDYTRNVFPFPGFFGADSMGTASAQSWAISTGEIRDFEYNGTRINAVKVMLVEVSPLDGKPTTRTFWQAFRMNFADGTFWNMIESNPSPVCEENNSCSIDNWKVSTDFLTWSEEETVNAFKGKTYFVTIFTADDTGGFLSANPFSLHPERGHIMHNASTTAPADHAVFDTFISYEMSNGVKANGLFGYGEMPDDWVNTSMFVGRVYEIDYDFPARLGTAHTAQEMTLCVAALAK